MSIPELKEEQGRWLEVWKKAEDIAVHFNQLIITFRLQALGGVTVAGGLVGTLLLGKDGASPSRASYGAFAGAMAFLSVLWFAIWVIDHGYYHLLLEGAVAEAERLETESGDVVRLSKEISKSARGSSTARKWFYVLPLAAFLTAATVAAVLWWVTPPPVAGCTKDIDCKGDRVCTAAVCVDAPRKAAPGAK
jgi:hypothetical protein